MTRTLPQAGHEHHERLIHHVDRIPEMADRLLAGNVGDVRRDVDEMSGFLTGTLIPHMEASERTLYPELERLFQNRHSMAPMRREHVEVRRLIAEFAALTTRLDEGRNSLGRALAFRRVAFGLYALLKIHLAEEEAYLRIVDHGVDAEVGEVLAAALEHPVSIS